MYLPRRIWVAFACCLRTLLLRLKVGEWKNWQTPHPKLLLESLLTKSCCSATRRSVFSKQLTTPSSCYKEKRQSSGEFPYLGFCTMANKSIFSNFVPFHKFSNNLAEVFNFWHSFEIFAIASICPCGGFVEIGISHIICINQCGKAGCFLCMSIRRSQVHVRFINCLWVTVTTDLKSPHHTDGIEPIVILSVGHFVKWSGSF